MPTAHRTHASRRRPFAFILAGALALALAACHQAPPPPSNATPEKAVATNLRLTAMGDFDGLMKNRLPPADYVAWHAEWEKAHGHPQPATATQQQQFAQIMQMLTAPGAEAKLAKRLAPQLAKMRGGKGETMPIASGILEAAGKQMIAASPQLGPSQKTLATQALDALIAWAKTTDFSDPAKAKRAIALICATARQLHVQTLQQWRALDYTQTMRNYGVIWNALENLLHIYGLDLAGSLTGAQISNVANDANDATVKLDMSLAGQPLTAEWPMVKVADHWYDKALLDAWHASHPASASTTATPPATGETAAPASNATSAKPAASASAAKPLPASADSASQ